MTGTQLSSKCPVNSPTRIRSLIEARFGGLFENDQFFNVINVCAVEMDALCVLIYSGEAKIMAFSLPNFVSDAWYVVGRL
jgi:hypothetical protein